MTRFDHLFQSTISRIYREGADVFNERTGYHTKALPGVTYEIEPSKGFPILTLRKIPLQLFVAEQVWFIMGEKKIEWMQQFTRIWDDFAEEDGTLSAAYGYRWRHHFGRDQLIELLAHLKMEPTSRQGVVMMWDPASDGLTGEKQKNVPCPFTYVVNIIDHKLNLHLIIRSNDMMLGNPHDTAGFALLQAILAQELGVEVGKLTISISHAHIYENHYEQAEEVIARGAEHQHAEIFCTLPERTFQRALEGDPELVREITSMFKEQYKPAGAVKKMQIAL